MSQDNKEIKFNNEEFYNFLINFDHIFYRYNIDSEYDKINELYLYLYEIEKKYYIFDFNSHGYAKILNNLKLIYGNLEHVYDYVRIYKVVHEKIIGQYLNIEGLDKLYNQSYFNFEWEMHLGINYNKQKSFFYRDHFIHQVRDLFEIHVLIDKLNLMKNCLDVIHIGESDTHVSKYINRMADIAIAEIEDSPSKNIYMFGEYKSYINYRYLKNIKEEENSEIYKEKFIKIIKDIFLKNIIKSSLFIAALFHDIGYPVAHIMNGRENIEKFLPNIHYFIDNEGHFGKICAQLANTLLFTLVKKDEIQKKYDNRDHGTISALALLLYYYENGTIYSLTKDKRAAIELGALAIYDHTIHAKYNTESNTYKKEKDPYYRLLFYINPISYLFRFCDDIQEWERIYFHVDENTHLRICHKCKTPLIRIPIKIDELLREEEHYIINEKYIDFLRDKDIKVDACACTNKDDFKEKLKNILVYGFKDKDEGKDIQFLEFDDTEFRNRAEIQYRKLYHIKTCHSVELISKTQKDEHNNEETYKLLIHIKYSPYKLLQMSFIAPIFSKYRSKELKQIKKYLDYQDNLPRIIMKSDITTNPLILKVNILYDFIKRAAEHDSEKKHIHKLVLNNDLINELKDINENILKKGKSKVIETFKKITEKIYSCKNNNIIERIDKQLEFYIGLLFIKEEYITKIKGIAKDEETKKLIKEAEESSKKLEFYGKQDIVDYLIEDYIKNFINLIDYEAFKDNDDYLPEKYYEIYKIDNKLIDVITQFTDEDRYNPFNDNDSLDAFIDIYFFKTLFNCVYLEFPE